MLIVGKDVKYGASGAVANAALTPNLLDDGSVGVYAIDPIDNMQKLVIVGSSGTGLLTATNFKGKSLTICQGLGSGKFLVSENFDVAGIRSITGSKFAAATGQTSYVGYNETTGSLNIPTLTGTRNEVTIGIREKTITAGNDYMKRYYTSNVAAGDTNGSALVDALVIKFNTPDNGEVQQFVASKVFALLTAPTGVVLASSTTGGTLAATTYFFRMTAVTAAGGETGGSTQQSVITSGTTSSVTATANAVTGAVSYRLYVSTTTGVFTGGYISSASPSFTYTGQSLTAGTLPATGTAQGSAVGIKLVAVDTTIQYDIFLIGTPIESATITTVKPTPGSGTLAQIQNVEAISNVYRGDFYTASTFFKHLGSRAVGNYDTYFIRVVNEGLDKTGQKATVDHLVGEPYGGIIIAFTVQADVNATNQQADFEDIMIAIYPKTQAISA